jgi:hypothetical protein
MGTKNSKLVRELREEFFARVLRGARRPMVLIDRRCTLVWLGNDQTVRHLKLLPYGEDPLVIRVHVNHYELPEGPDKIAKKTGWPVSQEGSSKAFGKLELSLLPNEVLEFAGWVANLIEFRENELSEDDAYHMTPPNECTFDGDSLEESSYAWSKAAETQERLYRK